MADPENFEDDLFADLYVTLRAGSLPPSPADLPRLTDDATAITNIHHYLATMTTRPQMLRQLSNFLQLPQIQEL